MTTELITLMIERGLVPRKSVVELVRRGTVPPSLLPLHSCRPLADDSDDELADLAAEIQEAIEGKEAEVIFALPKDRVVVVRSEAGFTTGWLVRDKLYLSAHIAKDLGRMIEVHPPNDVENREDLQPWKFKVRTLEQRPVIFNNDYYTEYQLPQEIYG